MADDRKREGQQKKDAAEVPEPRGDGRALLETAKDGTLTLTKPDGTVVEKVRLALAWPLRHRDRYIAVLDEKGKETFMASFLTDFAKESRDLVRREIERRYVETYILSVLGLRVERRVSYWEVATDRGRREFVVQGSETNPYHISDRRWQIIDVAGSRYEIADITALDARSQLLLGELHN